MPDSTVMGVLGPIPARDLGVVLPHEHLLIDLCRVTRNPDHLLDDELLAVNETLVFRRAGGATIVDVTNRGLGRAPGTLASIARATGLNIVMGAGWYREPFYDESIQTRTVDTLSREIEDDLTIGIDGIQAGIIGEIGADRDYISPSEEKVFRAAARAHLRTGVTITTHGVRSPVGLAQLDLLQEEGVDPRRVIVGHCDFYPHVSYHEEVARRGAYVEFDSIGRGLVEWDMARRCEWIVNLVRLGYLDQILLSHDVCMKSHLQAYGGQGYAHLLTDFVPRLLNAGLSPEQVDTILVANVAAALTGSRY